MPRLGWWSICGMGIVREGRIMYSVLRMVIDKGRAVTFLQRLRMHICWVLSALGWRIMEKPSSIISIGSINDTGILYSTANTDLPNAIAMYLLSHMYMSPPAMYVFLHHHSTTHLAYDSGPVEDRSRRESGYGSPNCVLAPADRANNSRHDRFR